MNTGSSAASNQSSTAIQARNGRSRAGTMIIRLTTATNTALFSPGWVVDALGWRICSSLRCKKDALLPDVGAAGCNACLPSCGGAGGV